MPLLLTLGAQLALEASRSYESCIAWPLPDTKGALLLPPSPPGILLWYGSFFADRGVYVAYVAASLVRAMLRACWGVVYVARARMLCSFVFSVGPSVGPGVCPFCLVLPCLMFLRLSVSLFVFA